MLVISYRKERRSSTGSGYSYEETFHDSSCEVRHVHSIIEVKNFIAYRLKTRLEDEHCHVILDDNDHIEISLENESSDILIPGKTQRWKLTPETEFSPGHIIFPASFSEERKNDILEFLAKEIIGKAKADAEREAKELAEREAKEKEERERIQKINERRRKEAAIRESGISTYIPSIILPKKRSVSSRKHSKEYGRDRRLLIGRNMSFEGYLQCICENGHYYESVVISRMEAPESCDECQAGAAWMNIVDDTNCNTYGEIPMELLEKHFLKSPGSEKEEPIFRIPTNEETDSLRHYRRYDGRDPLIPIPRKE